MPDSPMALLHLLVAALASGGDPTIEPPALQVRSLMSPNFSRGRAGEETDTVVLHYTAGKLNAMAAARVFASPLREASAHLCIGRGIDDVVQCVDFGDTAWHAGDGGRARMPSGSQLAALSAGGIVPIGLVPAAPRVLNRRSIGIEICNRGWAPRPPGPTTTARHRNPASTSTAWEVYPTSQIETLVRVLRMLRVAIPTLRWVIAHEDVTHGATLGDVTATVEVERKAGAKLDVGPAFPWSALPLPELGLVRVLYDFAADGWRLAA